LPSRSSNCDSETKQPAATRRIQELLEKNNGGTIEPSERAELDKYLRVGQFLDLIQAKARLSLQQPDSLDGSMVKLVHPT